VEDATRRIHWIVSGRVQGVGFRYHVVESARRHGVTGDVRNLPEGQVEVRAEGPPAGLGAMLEELRQGPRFARVSGVEESELDTGERFSCLLTKVPRDRVRRGGQVIAKSGCRPCFRIS